MQISLSAGAGDAAAAIDAGAAADTVATAFDIDLFGRRYRLAAADRAFWERVAAGDWERGTLRFFERALGTVGPDSVCVDVGAWVGPTALFAAQFCGRVFAVEPDPAAYERLLANLRMNAAANIAPCHAAIAPANGRVALANRRHFGNSMTRAQLSTVDDDGDGGGDGSTGDLGGNRATVLGLRLATFIDWLEIARIDLLKIDIEGGEFALLPALLALPMRLRPVVHLSVHAPLFPASERAEKLSTVAELAGQYAHIYDAENTAITADAIATDARFRDKFQVAAMSVRKLF